MQDERPNPDTLLESIKKLENGSKGKLKIFLGMAAGVGKTYSMLEAAHHLAKDGADIVVGVVNTHGRQDTEALVKGLTVIPPKKIYYKNIEFEELDLDAILKLKPQIVLVDEFAHTNVPGSRHSKRWQDVLEILDNGINVHTTLNVQHIESLKDVIENITGIKIRETVPDSIIEKADFIELIDIAPEELLRRLKEGKVYFGDKSELAAKNFFQPDNITALREIVLRYAAEKVDHDLRIMTSTIAQPERWKPREKLLVAISHSPNSQKLIRTARRISANLHAPWIAVHVDDSRSLSDTDKQNLSKNLSLARELGAEVITTQDPSIAEGIARTARQKGVTQIVIGRTPLSFFKRKNLINDLAAICKNVDLHVVKQEQEITKQRNRLIASPKEHLGKNYLLAALCVILFAGFNWLLLPYIGYKVIGFLFLIGILLLSLFFRKGPILLASFLYAIIWDVFFVPPLFQLHIHDYEDLALLALYLLTAISTGILVDRARINREMLIKREESTEALYEIVRTLAASNTPQDAIRSVNERLSKFIKGSFAVITKLFNDELDLTHPPESITNEKEQSAAIWVFENAKEAGWSTDTLPSSKSLYIPLKGFNEAIGVLSYTPDQDKKILSPEEKNFIYTVAQQLANYLERSYAEEKNKQNEQVQQVEQIHRNILDRVSTALQQPLQTAQQALKELKESAPRTPATTKKIGDIEHSSEFLQKTLANISTMARLTDGLIPLNKEPHSITELVTECCHHFTKSASGRLFILNFQEDLPKVQFDYYLIEMVLINLINNALDNSPETTPITIEVKTNGKYLEVSIIDEGPGIPPDQLNAIFDKFFSLTTGSKPGIGLGLPIAKTIAEIHQGKMKAENLPVKGAKFTLSLPLIE